MQSAQILCPTMQQQLMSERGQAPLIRVTQTLW
jgi:hypothetical protein